MLTGILWVLIGWGVSRTGTIDGFEEEKVLVAESSLHVY